MPKDTNKNLAVWSRKINEQCTQRRRSEDTQDITYISVVSHHFLKPSGPLHLANSTHHRDLFWANQPLRLCLYQYRPRVKLWPAIIHIIQTAPCLCAPSSAFASWHSPREWGDIWEIHTPRDISNTKHQVFLIWGPSSSNIIPLGFAPFTCPFV